MSDVKKHPGNAPYAQDDIQPYIIRDAAGLPYLSAFGTLTTSSQVAKGVARKLNCHDDMLEALWLARHALGANAARDAVDAAIVRAEGRDHA